MKTSNFSKSGSDKKAVSIAGRSPSWYRGREFKYLAPKYWFFKKYKEDGDKEFYIEQYKREVLDTLVAEEIYDELGEDAVLLCWEEEGEFCHRRLVAQWFRNELGVEVEEVV